MSFSDRHGVVGEVDIAVVACGVSIFDSKIEGGVGKPTEECIAVSRVDQSCGEEDTYILACWEDLNFLF